MILEQYGFAIRGRDFVIDIWEDEYAPHDFNREGETCYGYTVKLIGMSPEANVIERPCRDRNQFWNDQYAAMAAAEKTASQIMGDLDEIIAAVRKARSFRQLRAVIRQYGICWEVGWTHNATFAHQKNSVIADLKGEQQ